jgi:general stress protein CsbA
MLALFLCFVIQALVVFLKPRITEARFVIPAVVILLLITGAVGFYLRNMLLERLSIISLSAPLHRMTQFIRGDLFTGERVFYIAMQLAVFFLIPVVVIKRRQWFESEVIFAAVSWLFLFPFLQFSWNELGFRLLILAPLMLGPWLINLNIKFPKIAAVVFFAASILFTVESAANLAAAKGPDYRAFHETFKNIKAHAAGRRLIVHRGLAGFLWYEKGIRSENFLPVKDPERYLRLVYAFSPDVLELYMEPDDSAPVPINKTYMLIEEHIWQRFYQDRRELHFLKSELNPFQSRPVSAFVINEEISDILSPVSDSP